MSDPIAKSLQLRFIEVMGGRGRRLRHRLARAAAACASVGYGLAIRLRNRAYAIGLLASHSLPRPVISIGNVSAGGTGKTVLAIEVARWLLAAGRRPAVLLRGYKGEQSSGGSDEAEMLCQSLPGVAVVANPDRLAAARALLAGTNSPDVFVLDDGFQHRRVRRDLDIVTIDATMDLAGPLGRMLPRGLLREPTASLARADAIVLTRVDQVSPPELDRLTRHLAAVAPRAPVFSCRHAATGLRLLVQQPVDGFSPAKPRIADPGEHLPLAELSARKYLAFCGIGNPAAFSRTLGGLPGEPGRCVEFVAFDDHHAYSSGEIAQLIRRAKAAGAEVLVTTQKDAVKLAAPTAEGGCATGNGNAPGMPIYAVQIELAWETGPEPLRGRVLGLV